jgi:amino-acid N-acetyltransferase
MTAPATQLVREVVRLYVREQRHQARCGDGGSTVRCHVLMELLRQQGVTQQALVERLGLDKGWISRAVEALVADGTVSKQASEQDRRSVTLALTPAGRLRAGALEQQLNGHAAQLLARIPQDRHAQVQESLQLLLDALSGHGAQRQRIPFGPMALRRAALTDWPAIEKLLSAAGLPLDGARDHIDHFFVGEIDGELACAGGLEVYGEAALLRSIVVADDVRGSGCGRQLVDRLTHECEQLGVTSLYLLTTTAQSYFSRLGFAVLDRAGIPKPVRLSREFQGACPASATAMALHINRSESA